ncbi:hypothetical protein [Brevibacillus dissolubilis]|uniref:hypothetical protein n=1 Tax=Brevibacillus dissolubilis TaxID=1844116 RepID=UPI00159BA752|nr:hypothetical protein [Brevibacillus dissolubilis]
MKPYGNYRKLYQTLRKYDSQQVAVGSSRDLAEIHEIWRFYEKLSVEELRLINAAIKKTEAQIGYLPFCMTTVPIVFVIFSSRLSSIIAVHTYILSLTIIGLAILAVFMINRHFKNKSYNALHLHIVETILEIKKQKPKQQTDDDYDHPSSPSVSCQSSSLLS